MLLNPLQGIAVTVMCNFKSARNEHSTDIETTNNLKQNIMEDKKGFVYILSNEEYEERIKIGKSKKNPIIRADQLTRNTGAIGTFKLEWAKEVPSMDIAETFLHFTFRKFHNQKEFFIIDIEKAKAIAETALNTFFETDNKIQTEMNLTEQPANKEPNKAEMEEMEREAEELMKELNKM